MKGLTQRGFSTIEVLLAGALFIVFSVGVVEVVLTGLITDRLGQETTVAAGYAVSGMESVQAIKEDDFDALVPSSGTGLGEHEGFLVFEGAENTFEGKYARVIAIEMGKRDGDGDLTDGGGDEDPDTVRVTVTVSWQLSPTRNNSVVLQSYFTRWHL